MAAALCPLCCSTTTDVKELHQVRLQAADGRPTVPYEDADAYLVECETCGPYVVTQDEFKQLSDKTVWPRELRQQAACCLIERRFRGIGLIWVQLDSGREYRPVIGPTGKVLQATSVLLKELVADFPKSVVEKLQRCLLNLANMSTCPGKAVLSRGITHFHLFCLDGDERAFYERTLQERGWIQSALLDHLDTIGLVVTAPGWERVEELQKRSAASRSPAFVAQWFGGGDKAAKAEMDELCDAFRKAAEGAGYTATRVDLEEHNEYIMDKVIAMIKAAPFVIADFTGHRNGVYFEAGLARGLGLQVINTCKESEKCNAHFDIQQLNTIYWNRPQDVVEKIRNRILATVGPGPNFQV